MGVVKGNNYGPVTRFRFNLVADGQPGPAGPPGQGVAVAGSGFVHVAGGSIDPNASHGAAGQMPFSTGTDVLWEAPAGDLSLVGNTFTVTGIQGTPVDTGGSEGQFLIRGAAHWTPTSLSGDVAASATTPGKTTVTAIQGNPVTTNAPATNNVLGWTGSAWNPTAVSGLVGNLAGDATGPITSNTVSQISGTSTPIAGSSTVFRLYPIAVPKIMVLGDSLTAGGNANYQGQIGGYPSYMVQQLRQWRGDFEMVASQVQLAEGSAGSSVVWNEGHVGYTITQLASNWSAYMSSAAMGGTPDIVIVMAGTNDIYLGHTLSQMQTDWGTLTSDIWTTNPNAIIIALAPPPFVAGATVGGNLAAWNAQQSSFVSWLSGTWVPANSTRAVYANDAQSILGADRLADGIHFTQQGEAALGFSMAQRLHSLLGYQRGPTQAGLHDFRYRQPWGCYLLATPSTDSIRAASHPGFNPGSGSFTLAFDYFPTSIQAGTTGLVEYGSFAVNNYYAVVSVNGALRVFWENTSATIGGSTGVTFSENALTVGKWHRIVLMADATHGVVALYVNGKLAGLTAGVGAWTNTQQTFYLGLGNNNAAPGYYGRVWAAQAVPGQPGGVAALRAVEADYYLAESLVPGQATANFSLDGILTDDIDANPSMTLVGGAAAVSAYPGGAPIRPWESDGRSLPSYLYDFTNVARVAISTTGAAITGGLTVTGLGAGAVVSSASGVLSDVAVPTSAGTYALTYVEGTATYGWSLTSSFGPTWANDLVNSTNGAQYVSSISYSSSAAGGAVAINGTGTTFQIASGNTGFNLSQTAAASTSTGAGAAGAPLSFLAQAGQTSTHSGSNGGVGGNVYLGSGAGGSPGAGGTAGNPGIVGAAIGGSTANFFTPTGTYGLFEVADGNALHFAVGNFAAVTSGNASASALWLGSGTTGFTPSNSNYTLAYLASINTTILNQASGAGVVDVQVGGSTVLAIAATSVSPGAAGTISSGTAAHYWSALYTAPFTLQLSASQSQLIAPTTSTGGLEIAFAGASAGAGGSVALVAQQPVASGSSNGGQVYLQSGGVNGGSGTDGGIAFAFGGATDVVQFIGANTSANRGTLQWSSLLTPKFTQVAPGSVATPANFTIAPQAPNGASGTQAQNTPGSLIVSLSLPGAIGTAGLHATFQVQDNSQLQFAVGNFAAVSSGNSGASALWLGSGTSGLTPSNSNYTLAYLASINTTILNQASGAGVIDLQVGGNTILAVAAGSVAPGAAGTVSCGTATDYWSNLYVSGTIFGNTNITLQPAANDVINLQDSNGHGWVFNPTANPSGIGSPAVQNNTSTVWTASTSATTTVTIATLPTSVSSAYWVMVRLVGHDTGGATTTYSDFACNCVFNNASTLTFGTIVHIAAQRSSGAAGNILSFSSSGGNILVQITPLNTDSTNWVAFVDVIGR